MDPIFALVSMRPTTDRRPAPDEIERFYRSNGQEVLARLRIWLAARRRARAAVTPEDLPALPRAVDCGS